MPKQSARLAATLNSPPLTWIWHSIALRKGMIPGSSRWTSAPSDTRSSAPSLGIIRPLLIQRSLIQPERLNIAEYWVTLAVGPPNDRARGEISPEPRFGGALTLERAAASATDPDILGALRYALLGLRAMLSDEERPE